MIIGTGGVYGYTIYLEVPEFLYQQINKDIERLERSIQDKAGVVTRFYENDNIESVKIVTELSSDPGWREKAKAYVSGQGLTNQGRARSDNLAARISDGLLFRSQPEINLYRAFKSLGV